MVIGFTAGAVVLIASNQIKNFFDIAIPRGTSFLGTITQFFGVLDEINPYATAVSLLTGT
jgi:SulP family sulfate permease